MNTAVIDFKNVSAKKLDMIPDESVDLVITSPPYPMVEMWDKCFSDQSPKVYEAFAIKDWRAAFDGMHGLLDQIWRECDRVLKNNGFICINIGDATRSFDDSFNLFSNHTRVISCFEKLGYTVLPDIHWRKPSNSPNKFMGSGMYPAGAYVTYEHEYILVFRKGSKRIFKKIEDIERRRASAYFYEERNRWFSDLWEIRGTGQAMASKSSRARSAAFPLEIPYRLVNMYSVYGDTILDPFGGLGTTAVACAAAMRNCILCELDSQIYGEAIKNFTGCLDTIQQISEKRKERHLDFVEMLSEGEKSRCYQNINHGFKVKTRQETQIKMFSAEKISCIGGNRFLVEYRNL